MPTIPNVATIEKTNTNVPEQKPAVSNLLGVAMAARGIRK